MLLLLPAALRLAGQPLPRSTPEAEGVSAAGIARFVAELSAQKKVEPHSFMLLRHGRVVAESWWKPYGPALKHTLYSCSKSFTSTAVGMAVAEGKLKLTDRVASFFPELLPENPSESLRNMTVENLLIMSTGQERQPSEQELKAGWRKAFLGVPVADPPGSRFRYNSIATYMLSALVQKVTGQTLTAYLRPRLFEPLGISGMDWESSPEGIDSGGWGLRVKTEDMARFGQLYLQKGRWNGRQLVPESYVTDATRAHIMEPPRWAMQAVKDSSDWAQGYGYQFWRCRNNAYRADGAFGQYIIVMPEQDAVVVMTAESQDLQAELNLVWKHLLPALQGRPQGNAAETAAKPQPLALPLPATSATPATPFARKSFQVDSSRGLKGVQICFEKDDAVLTLQTDTATYDLTFGRQHWHGGSTPLPGPYLVSFADLRPLAPFRTAGHYAWSDPYTLVLTLQYTESPHHMTYTCSFAANRLTLEARSSFDNLVRYTWRGREEK